MTKQDLLNEREQIQNDIECVLDGADQRLITAVCQVVVDRFAVLISAFDAIPQQKEKENI